MVGEAVAYGVDAACRAKQCHEGKGDDHLAPRLTGCSPPERRRAQDGSQNALRGGRQQPLGMECFRLGGGVTGCGDPSPCPGLLQVGYIPPGEGRDRAEELAGRGLNSGLEVFAALRELKNRF